MMLNIKLYNTSWRSSNEQLNSHLKFSSIVSSTDDSYTTPGGIHRLTSPFPFLPTPALGQNDCDSPTLHCPLRP